MKRSALALVLPIAALVVILGGASTASSAELAFDKSEFRSALPTDLNLAEINAAGGSGPTGAGQPPRVGPNVQVNAPQVGATGGLIGRSETSITGHGARLVAGWNDAQGFCGPPFGAACTPPVPAGLSGYAFSTNGGETWTDGAAPPPFGGFLSRGDPWLDDDNANAFYYSNLTVDLNAAAGAPVGVWRGHFTGNSFAWDDVKTFDSPNNPGSCTPAGTPCDFYDKEALVAGKAQNKGDVYVSLTNFQGQPTIDPGCGTLAQFGFGQIEVWRSHDGGDTFQGPAIVGPEAPDSVASCGDEGTLQQSSVPVIAPNGDVYVVWQYGPTFDAAGTQSTNAAIRFARSTDGGETFSAPMTLAGTNSMRGNNPLAFNRTRTNDHPRIDVAQTGKNKGRIYVTYYSSVSPVMPPPALGPCGANGPPVPPNPPQTCFPQVLVSVKSFIVHSDDGGATWSAPQEIGGPLPTDPAIASTKRWWPDVSVSPGGEVHVVYYEEQDKQITADPTDIECNTSINSAPAQRRIGLYSALVDTWWTFSKNGGASWSTPLKLSSETTNWCKSASNIRPNMGDYIDAEAAAGLKVYGFWADARVTGNGFVPGPAFFPFDLYFVNSEFAAGKS